MYFLGFLVSLIRKLLCYAAFCQWRKIQPAHISLQQYFWFCGTCKYNSEKGFQLSDHHLFLYKLIILV